jgi:uncharacterized membrane protein YcaP (DUF421 family)
LRPFSWYAIVVPIWPPEEVIFRAAVVYIFVFGMFRILGRREWTRYSTFNVAVIFLVTVALRTTLVGDDSSLTSGVISFSTMTILDWLISYLCFRSETIKRWVSGSVSTLYENGRINWSSMRRLRLRNSDLQAFLRLHGLKSLSETEAIYMERDGRVSIQTKDHNPMQTGRPEKGEFPP